MSCCKQEILGTSLLYVTIHHDTKQMQQVSFVSRQLLVASSMIQHHLDRLLWSLHEVLSCVTWYHLYFSDKLQIRNQSYE